eukprot:scaffold44546_cov46-Cyclotella_meneghiniana.AAC.4
MTSTYCLPAANCVAHAKRQRRLAQLATHNWQHAISNDHSHTPTPTPFQQNHNTQRRYGTWGGGWGLRLQIRRWITGYIIIEVAYY